MIMMMSVISALFLNFAVESNQMSICRIQVDVHVVSVKSSDGFEWLIQQTHKSTFFCVSKFGYEQAHI